MAPDTQATPPKKNSPPRKHGALDDLEQRVGEARAQFDATNEKINARTGRNLFAAIGIGVTLGALFLVSLLVVTWLFMILAAVLIGFAVFELASALRIAGKDVPRVASTVLAVATVPVGFFFGVEGLWLALLVVVVLVTLWRLGEQLRPSHRTGVRAVLADVGAGVLVQVYVTFLAGLYVVLVGIDGPGGAGVWWTMAAIIVVVMTDIGAYASGLAFGRHKLAPTISPGKTWEGFLGSLLVAVLTGAVLTWILPGLGQHWWVGALLGLVLALVGTMGDLTESLLKRDLGVKDISGWLPGHGGFLDRLDSILPAGAVAYVAFLLLT